MSLSKDDLPIVSGLSSDLLLAMVRQPCWREAAQEGRLPGIAISLAESWITAMRQIEAGIESRGATKQ